MYGLSFSDLNIIVLHMIVFFVHVQPYLFHNKIITITHITANIQITGQYLKFDEKYASTNTCICSTFMSFLIRKSWLENIPRKFWRHSPEVWRRSAESLREFAELFDDTPRNVTFSHFPHSPRSCISDFIHSPLKIKR